MKQQIINFRNGKIRLNPIKKPANNDPALSSLIIPKSTDQGMGDKIAEAMKKPDGRMEAFAEQIRKKPRQTDHKEPLVQSHVQATTAESRIISSVNRRTGD